MDYFLISLSSLSSLVYKNVTGFYVLVLLPATLPNSLISSSSSLVASLGFSMYGIISFANSDHFTSSFPVCIPFISFYSDCWNKGIQNYWIKVVREDFDKGWSEFFFKYQIESPV